MHVSRFRRCVNTYCCVLLWSLSVFCSPVVLAETVDFQQQFDAIRQETGVASYAVVMVTKSGETRLYLGGVKDWVSREPVNADSIFRIGSVSKLFTGLSLLKAQELEDL